MKKTGVADGKGNIKGNQKKWDRIISHERSEVLEICLFEFRSNQGNQNSRRKTYISLY